MYNNKFSDQLLPLLTPEMLTRYPDQTCDIINKLIRLAQKTSSAANTTSGGEGNLEDIVQTTTSYADGGVNIVTAYLSDGTTQDFQIRNGHKGSQGDPGTTGADATVAVGTTTTLPAGSNATVTNVGVPSAAVFNFGIPKGADGQNGQDGQDGQDGFSPIATVSKSGDTATITITDENGTTTASVTDGADGAPGQAATVTAGTTTTLPAGSSASVVNSGTSSAAVFDFSIPKGDTGAAGQDGADGADGFSPIATVSKVGDTATITITDENGTTTASVTDGSDGAPGAAATIAAGTTTTLSPGSSATVTNSGTSSAAVFDFGIPQGATGATGADGFSPIANVTKTGDTATITITDKLGTTTTTVTDGADANVVNAYATSTTEAYSANYINTELEEKVNVASIDITGQTVTLLNLTKALGANGINYARWYSKTDGGTANISDKPTGSTIASFVCEARCSRWASNTDYTYQLTCWVQTDTNPYVASVTASSTTISWSRLKYTVRNATNATHTNYNNNQDDIPNMRFLSFWNGAYNSSGNSNLQNFATGGVKTAHIADLNVTNAKIANNTITGGKIANNTIGIGKLTDTGWLDCTYASGYKTSTNTGWKKLQARVVAGILYMRGGVSKNSGNFANTTEVQVASLPSTIANMISNDSNMNATGRGGGFILSAWTVTGTSDGHGKGKIMVNPLGGSCAWCSTPACFGPVA